MKESVKELWAIVSNVDSGVMWSRGGSSTPSRIMVYPSKKKAEAALNNGYTKQVIKDGDAR